MQIIKFTISSPLLLPLPLPLLLPLPLPPLLPLPLPLPLPLKPHNPNLVRTIHEGLHVGYFFRLVEVFSGLAPSVALASCHNSRVGPGVTLGSIGGAAPNEVRVNVFSGILGDVVVLEFSLG